MALIIQSLMDALAAFIIALLILLVVSRWSLWIAMFMAGFSLGFLSIPQDMWQIIFDTIIDPSVFLLAIAVGLIPIIGGIMDNRGLMRSLVNNMRIGKKGFLMLSPALVGMLPMPGGALLSAPLIESGGKDVPTADKVAINVWFRHLLYLIYPLSTSLIVGSKIAGLDMYDAIPWLFPFFALLVVIGYIFYVRKVTGQMDYKGAFSARGLGIPMGIILIAPVIDFILLKTMNFEVRETSLIIAVIISLALAIYVGKMRLPGIRKVVHKMKPWRFGLIVMGMFVFLEIFKGSGAPEIIASYNPPKLGLLIGIGFLLGFATGRVQLPISIIAPIYLANFGVVSAATGQMSMEPLAFAVAYFSIFLGYLISPIHPCNIVSLEYWKVPLNEFFRAATPSIMTSLAIITVIGVLFL